MSFYRTEVRTMQIMCGEDNEKFLNMVGDLLTTIDKERDEALRRITELMEYKWMYEELSK